MLTCIAADAALSLRAAFITFVLVMAVSLCADMPELGSLGRPPARRGPLHRDSGQRRGGRAHSRHLLFMAAPSEIRREPASATWFKLLTTRGTSHKVVLVAAMHWLNSLLKNSLHQGRLWQADSPTRELQVTA